MDEYEFCCSTCDLSLTYVGTIWTAEAMCPNCGVVEVSPAEIYDDRKAEAAMDAARDARLER